ncbi:hypothetical protein BST81_00225 [Leptolyngbya sp. 'hensonii']|nr:hypothetical protein BST81_00225 [Leptolyngbya sp. 'hensonii']
MEALIGLVLLWIGWLLSPRKWRQRLQVPFIIIALVWVLASPVGLTITLWGLTAPLPGDPGEPVDAIVLLGRGDPTRDYRAAAAQSLWQARRASRIFASGMLDARMLVQTLEEIGIPGSSLAGEECSQSTEENAAFTNAVLRPQGIQRILLVTDGPHMLRSFHIFRSFGFQVIPHPLALPAQLSYPARWGVVLRESLALIKSFFSGQFKLQPLEHLQTSPEVTQKIQAWGCLVKGKGS